MTDRELAGCPFCGGEARVRIPGRTAGYAIHVACRCGVNLFGARNHFASEAQAIAAWNRRTPAGEDARDAARLDWLCAVDPARRVEGGMGFRAYEDVAPLDVEHSHWVALTDRFYGTAREAIDAAIAAAAGGS